ncbi:MAG: GNAT family protein [Paludibacter sp.]|nr:GNAT family protein [Paludibacter sp.]
MESKIELKVNNDIYLKETELEDAEIIFQTINNEREYLSEWLPFVELTQLISDTQNFLESVSKNESNDLTFGIYFQHKFVGLVGLKDIDLDNKKTEIGYWLSELYQHKGIITLSCRTLIKYAFDEMNLNRIQLKAGTENVKSQRVAERLGFTREGIERDGELHSRGFVDLVVFGLLKADRK